MEFDLRALSLGAGVQSSVMYAMAARGELGTIPDVAIFADTQAEPPWVYERLDTLERDFGKVIPIHRITEGSLEKNLYDGGEGRKGFAQIPAYLDNPVTGKRGIGRRGCSYQYKIRPIQRACRELLGLKKGERAAGRYRVEQWIGISLDEASRAKDSDVSWVTRRYPLLFDRPMRRHDCIRYAATIGITDLRKSACYFCPYRRDPEWKQIRDEAPELWKRAVQIDADLRGGEMRASQGLDSKQYLHDSLRPLGEVDLDGDRNQPDLFQNECEGVCGV